MKSQNKVVARELATLIKNNLQSHRCLESVARRVNHLVLSGVLRQLSHQRLSWAIELQALLPTARVPIATCRDLETPTTGRLDWEHVFAAAQDGDHLLSSYESVLSRVSQGKLVEALREHHRLLRIANCRLATFARSLKSMS